MGQAGPLTIWGGGKLLRGSWVWSAAVSFGVIWMPRHALFYWLELLFCSLPWVNSKTKKGRHLCGMETKEAEPPCQGKFSIPTSHT